jgi:hypothetical protein
MKQLKNKRFIEKHWVGGWVGGWKEKLFFRLLIAIKNY